MRLSDQIWLFSTRWRARWRIYRNTNDILNRRVEVENKLMAAAKDGHGLNAEQCRELAYKLGVLSK
jgi:hypothetical protein